MSFPAGATYRRIEFLTDPYESNGEVVQDVRCLQCNSKHTLSIQEVNRKDFKCCTGIDDNLEVYDGTWILLERIGGRQKIQCVHCGNIKMKNLSNAKFPKCHSEGCCLRSKGRTGRPPRPPLEVGYKSGMLEVTSKERVPITSTNGVRKTTFHYRECKCNLCGHVDMYRETLLRKKIIFTCRYCRKNPVHNEFGNTQET